MTSPIASFIGFDSSVNFMILRIVSLFTVGRDEHSYREEDGQNHRADAKNVVWVRKVRGSEKEEQGEGRAH